MKQITKWITLEAWITPKKLRAWADRIEREMDIARLGQEVPSVEIKCYESNTAIVLRADQDAFHRDKQGAWR